MVLAAVLLTGCAGWKTEERLSSLESQAKGQKVLDMRLSRVEDRMVAMEEEMGSLQGGKGTKVPAAKGKGAQARPAEAVAAPVARAVQSPVVVSPAPVASAAPTVSAGSSSSGLGPRPVAKPPVVVAAGQAAAASNAAPQSQGSALTQALSALEQTQAPVGASTGKSGPRKIEPNPIPPAAPRAVPPPEEAQGLAKYKTGQTDYDTALATYEKGKYREAIQLFETFAAAHPKSTLVGNAIYWQGEARYSLGEYAQAVLLFKDVASAYPKHNKTPDALLKAGLSYAKLNDMENARFHWQVVTEDFPSSHAAALAKKYLSAKK
ncbi:tol-pal system protein YbgF [Desulfovibrio cuneatus]|uniref:tol-pal system protein YbgF n=1 Tax=Desulfovibrio cuneatus TaxID=159728 RepID=UPI00146F9719|nr:tol-pal system protein YbgF [Desulfovibrio cuneatus]